MQSMLATAPDKSIYEALIDNVLSDRSRYADGVGREFGSELADRPTENLVRQLDPDDISQFLALYRR
jgi:hypothetical protein